MIMSDFIVRLKGQQEQIVSSLIEQGVFSNKTEVVRAGILELYNKYQNLISRENEIMYQVAKSIAEDGTESVSEEDFLNKFPHLKKVKK